MEKYIKKSQTLYSYKIWVGFGICFILAGCGLYLQTASFYIVIILVLGLAMIGYIIDTRKLKASLLTLMKMTENIIEQKTQVIPPMDGESYIAVLSTHLYMLDIRMKGMIEKSYQEHNHLKDYIEDITHQIKTPLTAMILKEDILLELTDGEVKRLVEQMICQTQKIHYFVKSLLQLAQIESHSIIYQKNNYIFDELLMTIEKNLQPLLEQYHVVLSKHGEQEIIYCDFTWMSEAIENILKNCIEQKSDSSIDIICNNYSSYLQIIIHDHGSGFCEKDIPYIFERFYQSEYLKKNNGIGIGLSITKGVIDDHHGTISIYNDQGAVFNIVLPKKETKSKYIVTDQ